MDDRLLGRSTLASSMRHHEHPDTKPIGSPASDADLRPLPRRPHADSPRIDCEIVSSRPFDWRKLDDPRMPCSRDALIDFATRLTCERQAVFYALAKHYDGQDLFYRAALNIACGTDPERRDAILADFDKHFPEWNDKVADLVWELRPSRCCRDSASCSPTRSSPRAEGAASSTSSRPTTTRRPARRCSPCSSRDAAPEVKARAIENLQALPADEVEGPARSDELDAAIDDLLDRQEGTQSPGCNSIAAAERVDRH